MVLDSPKKDQYSTPLHTPQTPTLLPCSSLQPPNLPHRTLTFNFSRFKLSVPVLAYTAMPSLPWIQTYINILLRTPTPN